MQYLKVLYSDTNVKYRSEPVAIDTTYSNILTIDNGSKQVQYFVGKNTMFTDIYDIKTDNQFCNTLEDYIRERGAISELISRSAKVETSKRVLDITRGQINCTYGSPIIEYVISITVNQAKRV